MSVKKKYCLTYPEFYLLAGSMDISIFYGFTDADMGVRGDTEVVQLLFQLTKKHFLDVSETGYQIIEPIRHLFEGIRLAPKMIKVLATDNRFPMRCIYLGERPVVIELGGMQGNFLKLFEMNGLELFDDLCEDGILLPQNVSDDLLYQEKELKPEVLTDLERKTLMQSVHIGRELFFGEKLNLMGVQTILEMHCVMEGKIQVGLFLITRPLIDLIVVQKENSVNIYCYSQSKLRELVREMQEE